MPWALGSMPQGLMITQKFVLKHKIEIDVLPKLSREGMLPIYYRETP
jgi:hypothetical protein